MRHLSRHLMTLSLVAGFGLMAATLGSARRDALVMPQIAPSAGEQTLATPAHAPACNATADAQAVIPTHCYQ